MNSNLRYITFLGVASVTSFAFVLFNRTPIYFEVPKGWPKPHYDFLANPITEEGFQLGRHLFYDPILSRDASVSCASCHQQKSGFSDFNQVLSQGVDHRIGRRNALPLFNLAWSKSFMWDGGVNHIEVQPLNPITHPSEMDHSLIGVVHALQKSSKYKYLFKKAFGDTLVTGQKVLKALAQFQLLLRSTDAKYDQVMLHETTFTNQEAHGYELFQKKCASCHREPLFTNAQLASNGLPINSLHNDKGRMEITNKTEDFMHFKVPTLRNIQYTAPYMHDGRFESLQQVLDHYNAIAGNPNLSLPLNQSMGLNAKDKSALVAFLLTLSDDGFLNNPRFASPF